MTVEPVTLKGEHVELVPLSIEHVGQLSEFGLAEDLWRLTVNQITSEAEMKAYVQSALDDRDRGTAIPFATKLKDSDKIVGSTRFGNIDSANRRAEIGWTWIGPEWQRSFVNTEAKLLMLTHAFEVWQCIRVELKTDALNERSRNAILRLGAKEEGIFRNHMITDSGRFRNSVYFSIIDTEWSGVKAGLIEKLRKNK
jgi:N-acetyltransferase